MALLEVHLRVHGEPLIATPPRLGQQKLHHFATQPAPTPAWTHRDPLELGPIAEKPQPADGHRFTVDLTENMHRRLFELVDLAVVRDQLFLDEHNPTYDHDLQQVLRISDDA